MADQQGRVAIRLLAIMSYLLTSGLPVEPTPEPDGPRDGPSPSSNNGRGSSILAPNPALAPVEAPTSPPSVSPGSDGSSSNVYLDVVLEPYVRAYTERTNISLPDTFVVLNNTYRFVGEELISATDSFKEAILSSVLSTAGSGEKQRFLRVQFLYEISRGAPIVGPDAGQDAAQGPAIAPAPLYGPGRRLLQGSGQQIDPKKGWLNKNAIYRSLEVTMLAYGSEESSILQMNDPTLLNAYMTVRLAQAGFQVVVLPQIVSFGTEITPIVTSMPLTPIYVLGTVLEIHGTGFYPPNIQAQNILLEALSAMMSGQETFLWNNVNTVWSNAANFTIRVALKTYLKTPLLSIDEVAGGNTTVFMAQVARQADANFTVSVLSSQLLGTHLQELSGDARFVLDPTPTSTTVARQASGEQVSNGAIAGIAAGGTAATALFGLALVFAIRARVAKSRGRLREAESLEGNKDGSDGAASHLVKPLNPGPSSRDTSPSLGTSSVATPHQQEALNGAWNIDPADLAVCQRGDGQDWLLGSGSFGQVYRGLKGGMQDVAIKQLITPDTLHLKMFEQEVALMRSLNFDRNVVQFYGACIAEGNLMLVMEYMEQGDLREALGQDTTMQLGWYGKGAQILIDIARGLHFLHSNKVVHRDLKTKNILLTKNYEAKITDVGLSKLIGSQLLSTQLDTAGTFAYAAPELLLGEPCNEGADIYSYGVMLWELVTHEVPVRGALRGVRMPGECPDEVADVISSCLRRDPFARPTAKAIFDTFQRVLRQEAEVVIMRSSLSVTSTDAADEAALIVRN